MLTVVLVLATWCALSLPVGIAVGRLLGRPGRKSPQVSPSRVSDTARQRSYV